MEPLADPQTGQLPPTRSSRRSPNTGEPGFTADADVVALWHAIQQGTLVATIPDPEPHDPCPLCHGRGYLRRDVPVGHPDFGKAFPCSCLEPVLAQQRIDRLFGAAQLPLELAETDFATFALTPGDQLARARVEDWTAHGPHSLFLYGKVRRGKTGLALAAFRQRIATRQVDALYKSSVDLLDDIRATFDRETGGATTSQVIDSVKTVSLLLLDDLGKEIPTPWVCEQVYKIVDYRWRMRLPMIVTSNHTLLELGERFKEHGEAISWRITTMAEPFIVRVDGPNLNAG